MKEIEAASDGVRELQAVAHGLSVPTAFAEKAMASLMQLHQELMEEKEKRVALHRALLEKEQTVSELAMYVRLLEERIDGGAPVQPERSPKGGVEGSADPSAGDRPSHSAAHGDAGPSDPSTPDLRSYAHGEREPRGRASLERHARRPDPDDWKSW